MYQPLKFRRGDSSEWSRKDPILREGEPGFEIDTGRLKIGDGETAWSGLEYFYPGEPGTPGGGVPSASLAEHIADPTPHPAYDDGPSLTLLYENSKV